MEEKRFLDEAGLAEYHRKNSSVPLYLHTIATNQTLTSYEGEPDLQAFLFVISTNPTPAEYQNGLIFEPSHFVAVYGGHFLGEAPHYYATESVWATTEHHVTEQGDEVSKTFLIQVSIPQIDFEFEMWSGNFIGDTVTKL